MLKLMKYELQKQRFALWLIIGTTVLAQVLMVAGLLFDDTNMVASGVMTTFVLGSFSFLYMGIEGIVMYNRELKTKQGYMLFLTPNSSYKILGSKLLCNGLVLIFAGILFALLLMLDGMAITVRYEGFDEFIRMVVNVMSSLAGILEDIDYLYILPAVVSMVVSWIAVVTQGYLAVTLSATFLSNRKFNGLISIVVFLLVETTFNRFFNLFEFHVGILTAMYINAAYYLMVALICYGISGWMLEKKIDL